MSILNIRNNILASYLTNAFCIKMGSNVAILNDTTEEMEITCESMDDFSVFIHEYWHYLINMSTLTGFKDFRTYQSFITFFSKTLQNNANGLANIDILTEKDNEIIKALWYLYSETIGDCDFDTLLSGIDIYDFEILDYHICNDSVMLEEEASFTNIKLDIKLDTSIGKFDHSFNLGTLAIDEGLAYEVENIIYKSDNVPIFPYKVVRKLADYFIKKNITSYELCGILTFSLLTVNAPLALITLLECYSDLIDKIPTAQGRLRYLWESNLKTQYENGIEVAINDMEELVDIFKDRGLNEYAIDFICTTYKELLKKRLNSPLFDLDPVINKTFNMDKLIKLLMEVIPCPTIQEISDDEDEICKDFLAVFGPNETWKNTNFTPFDFLGAYRCQLHYLQSHLSTYGLQSSKQVPPTKCPFYTICDHNIRVKQKNICKQKPWETYQKSRDTGCWYNVAVSATLGTVNIKRKM